MLPVFTARSLYIVVLKGVKLVENDPKKKGWSLMATVILRGASPYSLHLALCCSENSVTLRGNQSTRTVILLSTSVSESFFDVKLMHPCVYDDVLNYEIANFVITS